MLEHKEILKLKFSDLTESQIEALKLKFDDLSEEDKRSLKGARGQRGRPGADGDKGDIGETGPRGLRGIQGLQGPIGLTGQKGQDGRDGRDGQDAAEVVDVKLYSDNKEMYFVFEFSDGRRIKTRPIDVPTVVHTFYSIGAGGSGDGGSGADGKSAYEIWIEEGNVGTEQDFLDSLIGADGADGVDGKSAYEIWIDEGNVGTEQDFLDSLVGADGEGVPPGGTTGQVLKKSSDTDFDTEWGDPASGGGCLQVLDEGESVTDCATEINFVGANVTVRPRVFMSDWALLSEVDPSIADYDGGIVNNPKVDVVIDFPDPSIIEKVDCLSSVYIGAFVRMTSSGVAVNALADSFSNSNVIGLVEDKISDTVCTLRVSGRSKPIYSSLDPSLEYFLSDTVPGALQTSVPTASGHIKLKLGQPFSSSVFLMSKGERVERL